jgi:hypothetical protein
MEIREKLGRDFVLQSNNILKAGQSTVKSNTPVVARLLPLSYSTGTWRELINESI